MPKDSSANDHILGASQKLILSDAVFNFLHYFLASKLLLIPFLMPCFSCVYPPLALYLGIARGHSHENSAEVVRLKGWSKEVLRFYSEESFKEIQSLEL